MGHQVLRQVTMVSSLLASSVLTLDGARVERVDSPLRKNVLHTGAEKGLGDKMLGRQILVKSCKMSRDETENSAING